MRRVMQRTLNGAATASGSPGLVFLATSSAAASATVDFTTAAAFDGTYAGFMVIGRKIVPATDSVGLFVRVAIASSFQAGANDYVWTGTWSYQDSASEAPDRNDAGTTGFDMSNFTTNGGQGLGSSTGENLDFTLIMMAPESTLAKLMLTDIAMVNETAKVARGSKAGRYVTADTAINGIRFLCSSDNITSGDFYLYGIRKA